MNIQIPDHIASLRGYKPGKSIKEIIKENNWEQHAILWNNENPLGSSPKAKEAVLKAFEGSNSYPDPLSLKLRGALARRFGKKIDNFVVSNGAEGVLLNIFKAFCSGDDEVLTSAGSFVIIYIWAQINNTKLVQVPLTEDYRFDLQAMKKKITKKTKLIYLSNINNPTGAMITREELVDFLDAVPDSVLVIIDEAYFEFSNVLTEDFPDATKMDYDNVIVLRTFSKAYGIAATRIGYGIAHEDVIAPLMNVKLTFEPSNLAQAAGLACLDDPDFLEATVQNNKAGIYYYYKEFERLDLKYVPSFGNFVMVDFGTEAEAQRIFNGLKERGVFVRPLNGSGLPHCIRISVGTMKENEYCVAMLREVL